MSENGMEKVLLVEDNPGHAYMLREMLKRTAPAQFELTHVERLEQALAHLEQAPYDLLLLDLSLPDSQGFETFARARAQAPDTPIIVLSGYEDEELAIRAVREGAQDYLIKGHVDGNLLARAIRYAIERGRAEALVRAQRDLGLALGAAVGLEQVLRLCVEAALRIPGMDCGGVYLVDMASGGLDLVYQKGLSPEFAQDVSHYDADSMQARLTRSGRPVYSLLQELNLPEGLRALAVIPIQYEGQVIACLNVASRTQEQPPVFARNALDAIAAQIGSVIARVQAEQELRKFKTIADSADYGVSIADLAGNILYTNPRLAVMHGYGPDELIGQNLAIFHGGAQLGEVLERRAELQERGSHSAVEIWSERKDGSTFPALMNWAIIKDQAGKPLFVTATMTDITQREQARDALQESEGRYRTLFESASIGVGLSTMDGKAITCNEAILQMTGYTEAEIKQVSLADTYAQPHERVLLMERMQRDGFVKDFEVGLKRKDGTTYFASLTVTRVTLEGEDVLLTMAQDITERVRAQEQLEHYAFELERSNQELQRFIHVASHDLQEPLRMVTSYLQLLEQRYKGQLDADADDFIAFAVNGATRMRALIKDLLAYSQVAARGKPFEPTDCRVVLEQVLNNLQTTVDKSGASVTHDPLPTLMADGAQLAQLFHDLVSNALKFRGERPPEIHVGAERRESEWLFSVRDNGTGIEPQYFERIFHIFQRLHTWDEYPGTGIGLAICKRIVERHGGRLWVESEPREGSTFYFTLLEDVTAAVTS